MENEITFIFVIKFTLSYYNSACCYVGYHFWMTSGHKLIILYIHTWPKQVYKWLICIYSYYYVFYKNTHNVF